ncbi:hypothetical protein RND81_10G142900 [Saponaria officinalis]|uniref:Differentiation-associated protein 1 n=1 Tax=Saponaria officinalis TaxID=3572 RepID=A0AAW1I4R2_SAPOF
MVVSLNPFLPFNSITRSCLSSPVTKISHVSSPLMLNRSKVTIKPNRRISHVLAAESDLTESVTAPERLTTDSENPASASPASVGPTNDEKATQKKAPLTARERLRAARVLSRYAEPKPAKAKMGRSVLDALRESEKGKKGLPQAPTNLLDDQKRGMPKAGLTFDFPGGFDLFVIAFSFVFISTVMFATTYFVWKLGAIHFNEN